MSADAGTAWIVLIGTLFGSAGLKVIESFLNRRVVKDDSAAKFRGELSSEIESLRAAKATADARVDEVEAELEVQKDKFWQLRADYVKLQAELLSAFNEITKMKSDQALDGDKKP